MNPKIIKMAYPKSGSAIYFDGKVHNILPVALRYLYDNNYQKYLWFLNYVDINSKTMHEAFLEHNNGVWTHIPLTVYDDTVNQLINMFKKNGKAVELSHLGNIEMIDTIKPIPLEDYIKKPYNIKLQKKEEKKERKVVDIYFNNTDGFVYTDPELKKYMVDQYKKPVDIVGLSTLGNQEGNIIHSGYGVDFRINNVASVSEYTNKLYYNEANGKYYLDPKCQTPFDDDVNTLGKVERDQIVGEGITYPVEHVYIRMEEPKKEEPKVDINTPLYPIYYNEADGKYYADEACQKNIEVDLNALGRRDGNLVISSDKVYDIRHVYKKKNVEQVKEEVPVTNNTGDSSIYIYYNKLDQKYYFDPECTKEIVGGPSSLGHVGIDVINGFDGKLYTIVDIKKEMNAGVKPQKVH